MRVGVLGIVAGFAAAGAWNGTTPLMVVAGAALFVAALDALEPLAQELDHPTRLDSYPLAPGPPGHRLAGRPDVGAGRDHRHRRGHRHGAVRRGGRPHAGSVIPATAAAVAGGTASLVLEPVSAAELMSRYPVPEAAGPVLVARLGFAPGLAISGWLPLLAGRAALHDKAVPRGSAVFQAGVAVVGLSMLIVRALCAHFERKRAVPEP